MVMAMTLGASAAFAGEVTGNPNDPKGLWTVGDENDLHHELQGKSLCAFSGQNDGFHFPQLVEPNIPGDADARVQSWGQIPKQVRDTFPSYEHPGNACNPNGVFPPPPPA
jgi:hypothetical protein